MKKNKKIYAEYKKNAETGNELALAEFIEYMILCDLLDTDDYRKSVNIFLNIELKYTKSFYVKSLVYYWLGFFAKKDRMEKNANNPMPFLDVNNVGLVNQLLFGMSYKEIDEYFDNAYYNALTAYQKGEKKAGFVLGEIFIEGLGNTENNINKAFEYLDEACKAGSVSAAEALVSGYLYGINTEKDYSKAVEYIKIGLEIGSETCKLWMADCYRMGWGVIPDGKKAIEYYLACDNDYKPMAYLGLANIYMNGEAGISVNYDLAYKYASEIMDKNPDAKCKVACMMFAGLGCQEDMEKAVNMLMELADAGYDDAEDILNQIEEYCENNI